IFVRQFALRAHAGKDARAPPGASLNEFANHHVVAVWALTSESTSSRSFSTKVRSVSRKMRWASERSRNNKVCSDSSLHFRIVESSFARADAERGIPHKSANSPRIVPGLA